MTPELIAHSQLMLNAFQALLGRELMTRSTCEVDAYNLFHAPFIVVSHGTQADPILNYGNQAALDLWETSFEMLTQMPSRLTAEPMHRDERAQLLARTTANGFVDDYHGIRITTTGKRFRIHSAIVWNLRNDQGDYVGQAATFSEYTFL